MDDNIASIKKMLTYAISTINNNQFNDMSYFLDEINRNTKMHFPNTIDKYFKKAKQDVYMHLKNKNKEQAKKELEIIIDVLV